MNFKVVIRSDVYIEELLNKAGGHNDYTYSDFVALCRCLNAAGLAETTNTIDLLNDQLVCLYSVTDSFRATLEKQGIDPAASKAKANAKAKNLLNVGKEVDQHGMNNLDA